MLMKRLSHENVVTLHEVLTDGDGGVISSFEFCAHDLAGLIESPKMNLLIKRPARVRSLSRQLFAGIDHAHANGVLHRDIKAANLLVTQHGVLKIADWGLARTYDLGVPRCCGAFTPSTRLVSIRRGRGSFYFDF